MAAMHDVSNVFILLNFPLKNGTFAWKENWLRQKSIKFLLLFSLI